MNKTDEIKAHLIELFGTIDELRSLAKMESDPCPVKAVGKDHRRTTDIVFGLGRWYCPFCGEELIN